MATVRHGKTGCGACPSAPDRSAAHVPRRKPDIGQRSAQGIVARDELVETIQAIEYGLDEARVLFNGRPAENIRLIALNSDSMAGTFAPRDQLFVDISVHRFDGDGIYLFNLDNQLYLKRLQLQHKKVAVISDNKRYETGI